MNAGVAGRMQRYRTWLIAGGAVVAIYALLGFFWAPRFARDLIEDYVRSDLQRRIVIGAIRFNPFTLTARLDSVSLTEADDSQIAGFDRLVVNAELSSIFRGGGVFKEITLTNPHALVRVEPDGSLNLAKLTPPQKEPKPAENSELPTIRIGKLNLRGGQVVVEDRSRPKPFKATFAPIEFSLDNFRTEPKFGNAYRFLASTQEGERFDWSGEFSVQPLGSTGRFTLANIKAATIAAYLQDALPFALPTGVIDVQGEYRLAFTDRVDFKLKLPIILAKGFGVAAREEPAPWISIPELSIANTEFSLADRTVVVDEVRASELSADVWKERDGSLNLSRLFPASGDDSKAASASDSSWRIDVKRAQLQRARVNAEDRSVSPPAKFVLSPLNVNVERYSTAANSEAGVEVDIGINESGSVKVSGPVTLSPLALKLKVAVKNFNLVALQPYAAQSTDMTIHRGAVTLNSDISYAATPAKGRPQFTLSGDAEINDLLTKDNALEEDLIKWQSLKVSGIRLQQKPDSINIERVVARKPYGRVIIASNGTFNITQVLNPRAAAKPKAGDEVEATKAPPMPARIRSMVIEDGSASFADYSVQPSFATEMMELKGSVDGLSSAKDSRAKVQLSGSVDRYAPVSISGEVNLLSNDTFTDLTMAFRNMELTTFNPYSGKFAGYNITKGKLTTEMYYKVENRMLDARHRIVVDQLEFGEATGSKDAVSLPVKLAVALLKDRHGVIDLDLPVSGNLDDPKFRIGPIVWQVLKNTLEKIVTAPFAMLGRLFGGGEELAFVDFAYGATELTPDVKAKIDTLKKAMLERPQLKLDVPMRAFGEGDATSIARTQLDRALAGALQKNPDRFAALSSVYNQEFSKAPAYPESNDKNADVEGVRTRFLEDALLAKFAATPAQLEELGRARGNAVRDALLSAQEIDPERVFLSNRAPEGKSPAQAVRMELKVE